MVTMMTRRAVEMERAAAPTEVAAQGASRETSGRTCHLSRLATGHGRARERPAATTMTTTTRTTKMAEEGPALVRRITQGPASPGCFSRHYGRRGLDRPSRLSVGLVRLAPTGPHY